MLTVGFLTPPEFRTRARSAEGAIRSGETRGATRRWVVDSPVERSHDPGAAFVRLPETGSPVWSFAGASPWGRGPGKAPLEYSKNISEVSGLAARAAGVPHWVAWTSRSLTKCSDPWTGRDRKSTRLNSSHQIIPSAATLLHTLSLHDALPIFPETGSPVWSFAGASPWGRGPGKAPLEYSKNISEVSGLAARAAGVPHWVAWTSRSLTKCSDPWTG